MKFIVTLLLLLPITAYAAEPGAVLFDNWNKGGCGYTDTIRFNLKSETNITRLRTWINWPKGQQSIEFILSRNDKGLYKGRFRRKGCDPYQQTWCEGVADWNRRFEPGRYKIKTTIRRVCHNRQSNNNGYLALYGTAGNSRKEQTFMGHFSGQWNVSFRHAGIDANGGGDISIRVYPDDGLFTCEIKGSVSGSGSQGRMEMSVSSSVVSSGCKGSYDATSGNIDGSFKATERGKATITQPGRKPKNVKTKQGWPGTIQGRISRYAGKGSWADDEGRNAEWSVSGSFAGKVAGKSSPASAKRTSSKPGRDVKPKDEKPDYSVREDVDISELVRDLHGILSKGR